MKRLLFSITALALVGASFAAGGRIFRNVPTPTPTVRLVTVPAATTPVRVPQPLTAEARARLEDQILSAVRVNEMYVVLIPEGKDYFLARADGFRSALKMVEEAK